MKTVRRASAARPAHREGLSFISRRDLVRVEATVIEKTESWPKINMKFKKRKNYRKKRSK